MTNNTNHNHWIDPRKRVATLGIVMNDDNRESNIIKIKNHPQCVLLKDVEDGESVCVPNEHIDNLISILQAMKDKKGLEGE